MKETAYDFPELIKELDAGIFANKLSIAVRDVAQGVVANSGPGKVTIELTFKQSGDSNQVLMAHTLKYAKPTRRGKATEEDTTSTPLWVGQKGLTLMPDTQEGFKFTTKINQETTD